MKPENLKQAIEQNVDITALTYNHYHLLTSIVFPLFKLAMKMFWTEFETTVTQVPKIYQILAQNPDNIPILETPQAKAYLNFQCERFYRFTYYIVWLT